MRILQVAFGPRSSGAGILVGLLLACSTAIGGQYGSIHGAVASSPMGGCSATIERHHGPQRFPFEEITSVAVRCGDTEGAVLRLVGSAASVSLEWTGEQNLRIRLSENAKALSRSTSMGDVDVEFEPPLPESTIVYGELPRSEWPSTCLAGAQLVEHELPAESRAIIRGLSDGELREMRLYWGAMLARHFALYNGNSAMLESCGGAAVTAGAAIVDLVATSIRADVKNEE